MKKWEVYCNGELVATVEYSQNLSAVQVYCLLQLEGYPSNITLE